MVTARSLIGGLFLVGLGALGGGVLVADNSNVGFPAQIETPSDSVETTATTTFLSDEIVFRSRPSFVGLLSGEPEEASAVAIVSTDCDELRTGHSSWKTLMVSTRSMRDTRLVTVTSHAPAGMNFPTCPVKLTVQVSVADSAQGWLVNDTTSRTKNSTSDVVPEALTTYRIERIISRSGYGLLGGSALAIAGVGLLWAWYKKAQRRFLEDAAPKYPVMAGIAGALSAVSVGGSISWTTLVPGLDIGGIVVVGLMSAVLVASGESLVAMESTHFRKFWTGHFLRLFGTAVLALLTPFILLHGADVGMGGLIAWVVIIILLTIAGCVFRPPAFNQTSQSGLPK